MKARQKLMSLLGVTLLLASTILTPISTVVAQTQNSTQTSQTTSGSKEVSKEQAQQSSSTTNTGDKSKQSPKGAESSKSNKTEEKSETQPGAPPRSKRTRRAAFAGALDVKEVDDGVITSLDITDEHGRPLTHALKKWETFKITGTFKLPNNQVNQGDKTTIKLPNELQFSGQLKFEVKDSNNQVVAHAVADATTKTLTLTYTDYPSKRSNVTGSFYFYAYVDHKVVKTKQKVNLQFLINKRAIAKSIDFDGIPPAEKSNITKSGWIDSGKVLHYQVPINRAGLSFPNAVIKDTLPNTSLEYLEHTFRIYKGTWTPNSDQAWVLQNQTDVTNQFKSKLVWTENGFTLDLGNVSPNEGYYITYDVKAKYTPVDGEKFVNNVKLLSQGAIKGEVNFTNSYFEGGGKAPQITSGF